MSLLITSVMWFIVTPLRAYLAFGILIGVLFQEILRFLFFLLIMYVLVLSIVLLFYYQSYLLLVSGAAHLKTITLYVYSVMIEIKLRLYKTFDTCLHLSNIYACVAMLPNRSYCLDVLIGRKSRHE